MGKSSNLLSNLIWKFAERISAQFVTFVVSIILARLLRPEDYGIISIVTIFITLANVFVSDGFGSALIQKKNADTLDYSSVLWFNLFFSILIYGILFILAPFISSFYGRGYEILSPVLRVLGVRIILSSINSVQQAYVSKHMIFRKFFVSTLSGTILSAIVGIIMAYMGFGVWALVAQYLVSTITSTIVLFFTVEMKIEFHFSINRLKGLVGFGSKILGTNLLITGFQELRALIIGKVYSSVDLAFYDKGRQFPNLIVTNINSSIGAVLFPKLSNEQDDVAKVKRITRNSIRFSSYIMSPLMLGLAVVAESFVEIVLTEKWIPCVPLMQLFCIVYLFQPIHTANMQAIKAIGRGDTYLKLEIVKKMLELVSLLAVMKISVEAIVISMAVLTTAFTFVNTYPNIKFLGYTLKEQLRDILPSVGMATIMCVIVYMIGCINIERIYLFVLQILCGIVVYILLSIVTKNKEFEYIYSFIKNFKK